MSVRQTISPFQDEEYEKMEEFKVDKRRIVIVDDDPLRLGGYGIVQRAELHHSVYLPTWLALRRYGPPQPVAVKQIKVSVAGPDLKRVKPSVIDIFSWLTVVLVRLSRKRYWCGPGSRHIRASPGFLASTPISSAGKHGYFHHGSLTGIYVNSSRLTTSKFPKGFRW